MLEAHWFVVVHSAFDWEVDLGFKVEQGLTFWCLPKVVGLLVGLEEWMSSGTRKGTLPT